VLRPLQTERCGLAGNGFGEVSLRDGGAAIEEAAGGEEFGVEQGGTGSAADQVVREQISLTSKSGIRGRADDGGHAVAGIGVAAGLRAIFVVEDDDRIFQGGGREASSAPTSKLRRASRTS